MSIRPRIIKITVDYEGGQRVIDTNEPGVEVPEAIFFGNVGVNEILTPFYVNNVVEMTKADVEANWGTNIANAIYGPSAPGSTLKRIDQFFIDTAWNTQDDNGKLLPMILKKPRCPLE